MKGRSTFILVVVALALGALIYWVERPMRLAQEQPLDRKVLPDLDAAKVTSLEVSSPFGIVRALQTNHIWRLTRPISYPADGQQIDALLKALAVLEWRTAIGADELTNRADAQDQFGFDKPMFSLVLDGSGPSRHLLVGKTSALKDQVYLQVVGNPSIYLAGAALLKLIPTGKDQWRDRAVLDAAQIHFDGLKVRSQANRFDLEREPGTGLWRMKTPLQVRADSPKIDDLLDKLRRLRIVDFASDDPQPDADSLGLQTPALDLSFTQGTNVVLSLQLGASLTNKSGLAYARRSNPSSVVIIPAEALTPWEADQRAFLDRHLMSVSPALVGEIDVSADDKFTLLRQTNGAWQARGEKTFGADKKLVDDWLSSFTNIEVQIEQTVVADLPRYGLDKPVAQYILKSAPRAGTNEVLAQFNFGATATNRVYESRADESPVNSIAADEFSRFPRASWQFRERRIWHFVTNDIQSVTVRQQGTERKFIRDPSLEWTMAPGSRGGINPFHFEETMYRLTQLKAIYWDGRGDDPQDAFGIRQTDHSITIEVKGGDKVQNYTIQFGKPSPFTHPYAAVVLDGERLIFEFPVDIYNSFVAPDLVIPAAFRKKQ